MQYKLLDSLETGEEQDSGSLKHRVAHEMSYH